MSFIFLYISILLVLNIVHILLNENITQIHKFMQLLIYNKLFFFKSRMIMKNEDIIIWEGNYILSKYKSFQEKEKRKVVLQ